MTPEVKSILRLKKTIQGLTNGLSLGRDGNVLPALEGKHSFLGKCLLFCGDDLNAYNIYELGAFQRKLEVDDEDNIVHLANCDRCDMQLIRGLRYLCRSCADVDLCQACYEVFRKDQKTLRCQNHEFWKVPRDEFRPVKTTNERRLQLANLLTQIKTQYAQEEPSE